MTEQTLVENMNRVEAEACLIAIRGHFDNAQQLALDFDRRLGWKTLGYASLKECFKARLGYSWQHGYRLRDAGEVTESIQEHSPTGESVHLKERWVRESGIMNLDAVGRTEAHQIVRSVVKAAGREPTAWDYTRAVNQVNTKNTVFQSSYPLVTHLVATGAVTADRGREIVTALDRLKTPKLCGYILQLISTFKLFNPELFQPIAGMFDRKPGHASLVLPEVKMGFLGGVPLERATLVDLHRANTEAAAQHQAKALEEQRRRQLEAGQVVIEYKTLSLPVTNWKKCIEIIRRDLGDHAFEQLMRAGMQI